MANILEYTLSLKENLSANLQNIGVNTERTLKIFANLEKQSKETTALLKETGGSVGSLRERLSLLRSERDWIPAKNLKDIRAYNSEITKLEKNINKLETINGSRLKKWGKEAFEAIPGARVVANPLVLAATAIGVAGKSALSFDEGMAKVNVTAELQKDKLATLKTQLLDLGQKYGAEMGKVPDSFEAILSVLGEVNPSLQVFETSLKGAKATGTELDIVSKALASTKSILNEDRISADEVLNTFLAAKRVGAGEFKDFASYMPGLIASAGNLGIKWKQATGLFAYMTTKVASASDATMLMQNVFTALGKSEIQKGLSGAGVELFNKKDTLKSYDNIMLAVSEKIQSMTEGQKLKFVADIGINDSYSKKVLTGEVKDERKLSEIKDKLMGSGIAIYDKKGSIRQIEEIMGDLSARMKGLSDEQKTNFLESIGLRDSQAKQGIAAMVSDPAKLGSMMQEVQGSAGEIDAALNLSKSGMQEIKEMWARLQVFAIKGGGLIMNVLAPVIALFNHLLSGIASGIGWVGDKLQWMWQKLREGNEAMWQWVIILGAVASGLMLNYLWINRMVPVQILKATWDGIVAASTGGWAAMQTWLNGTLLANPLTWIIALVVALVGAIAYVIWKTQGWGEAWQHVVQGSKLLFSSFVEGAKNDFNTMVDNLMIGLNAIKKAWFEFKRAVGIGTDADNNTAIAQISADTERRKKEIREGGTKVAALSINALNEFKMAGQSLKMDENKTVAGAVKKVKDKLGIGGSEEAFKATGMTGKEVSGGKNKGSGGQNAGKSSGQKANEAIATGGTRNTTINITIGKQESNVTVQNHTGKLAENKQQMQDMMLDMMIRSIASAQSLA
jgi:TP901 family phage tail tape measure protein